MEQTERYADLQRQAKEIGGEIRVTLYAAPVKAGAQNVVVRVAKGEMTSLEAALDSIEESIKDPVFKRAVDLLAEVDRSRERYLVAKVDYEMSAMNYDELIDAEIGESIAREESPTYDATRRHDHRCLVALVRGARGFHAVNQPSSVCTCWCHQVDSTGQKLPPAPGSSREEATGLDHNDEVTK